MRGRQRAWFELHCPKGLPGTTRRVMRDDKNGHTSAFDAKVPGPEWQRLSGSGQTELGALYSVNLQLAKLVWWRMGGGDEHTPLPAVLTPERGKKWRATSVKGFQRDFDPGEEPRPLAPFVFAVGKTREDALGALASKLGVDPPKRRVRVPEWVVAGRAEEATHAQAPKKVEPTEVAARQVGPGLAWSDDEARLLEDGG